MRKNSEQTNASLNNRHIGNSFGFPFCQRLWDLTKRQDDIALADMVAYMVADMEMDMVVDMEVDNVADKVDFVFYSRQHSPTVADMVANKSHKPEMF